MRIAKHPTLNIFAREDGAVLLPPCVRHPVPDWTFGRKNDKGYMEVKFLYKHRLVHRIIAEAFLENPNKYKTVDHINRNRSDNNLSNLRWANQKMQSDNKKSVEDAIAKYGVRCCDDREAYEKARYDEIKKDHNWVVNKRRKIKEWADKNRDKVNERQRARRERLREEINSYERERYAKNKEKERLRQRNFEERMKSDGKIRMYLNGKRKWVSKGLAEKFKEAK